MWQNKTYLNQLTSDVEKKQMALALVPESSVVNA